MVETTILYSCVSVLILIFALKLLFQSKNHYKNLPPSPPSLPIIGHLHLLKPLKHRTFHQLSQKYGPIFSLRLGSRLAIVVSSVTAAEECFTKNDVVLCNRPKTLLNKHIGYEYTLLTNAPYGDHWRNLRRICALEIFSSNRLNNFTSLRTDEVKRLLKKLSTNSLQTGFAKVELKPLLIELNLNIIMRMVSGKRHFGGDEITAEEETKEFRDMIAEITKNAGVSVPADFLPVLNWLDNGKFVKRICSIAKRMDAFIQGIIEEHRHKDGSWNTMVDHLLSLQETKPENYSDKIIKGLILVMMITATESTSITLEWAMSNLLNHPEVLKKVKEEVDAQVGQECLINEADVSKLPYMQNIILETLRLYTATPLLGPHLSSSDCTVGGYDVPAGTILLVNAWAIHRDPNLWDDPTSFKPERFERERLEGHKLMPFGMGRRACPAMGLAHCIMGLTLGSLIQCFEWTRVDGKEVDMTEARGQTMPKAQPMVAICKPRPIIDIVFPQTV